MVQPPDLFQMTPPLTGLIYRTRKIMKASRFTGFRPSATCKPSATRCLIYARNIDVDLAFASFASYPHPRADMYPGSWGRL